jgi:hypothetical protein
MMSSLSSPRPHEGVDITRLGGERRCDAVHPLLQLNERRECSPKDQGGRSSPSHTICRCVPPPPPPPCSLISTPPGMLPLECIYILETLSKAPRANHSCWSSRACLPPQRGRGTRKVMRRCCRCWRRCIISQVTVAMLIYPMASRLVTVDADVDVVVFVAVYSIHVFDC